MAITLIPEDQLVIIDDQSAEFPYTTDTEIHAVHWDGARGTVEYNTARAAEHITDISPWQSIIDKAKAALVKPDAPPTVATKAHVKLVAASLLQSTDWMVIRAAEGGAAAPSAISRYRAAVRAASNTIEAALGTMTHDEMAAHKAWPTKLKEQPAPD